MERSVERRAKESDHTLSWALNWLGFALACGCFFVPVVPVLVASALMPWVGLLVVYLSQRRLVISEDRHQKKPNIALMIALPAAALCLKEAYSGNFLDLQPALVMGVAVATVWIIAFWCVQRPQKPRDTFKFIYALVLMGGFHGLGVVALVDTAGDTAVVGTFTPAVLAKHPRQGRGNDVLVLEPWGPRLQRNEPVERDVYDAIAVGDRVCIDLYSGRLSLKWYRLALCPRHGPSDQQVNAMPPA